MNNVKFELVKITPAIAREMLKKNTRNRVLREGHVQTLMLSMQNGEWQTTHQGIAFSDQDELLDGQHRLEAFARMPEDFAGIMVVSRGWHRDTVFPTIDAVQCKRNVSDVLRIERALADTATFLARVHLAGNTGLTPIYVEQFADWARPRLEVLLNFAPRKVRTWATAPVRAAAIVAMEQFRDPDYVCLVYGALVNLDYNAMSRVVQTLVRGFTNGNVRASQQTDLFLRCIKVFNSTNANLAKVQIMDPAKAMGEVRDLLARCVLHKITDRGHVTRPAKVSRAAAPRPHLGGQ